MVPQVRGHLPRRVRLTDTLGATRFHEKKAVEDLRFREVIEAGEVDKLLRHSSAQVVDPGGSFTFVDSDDMPTTLG